LVLASVPELVARVRVPPDIATVDRPGTEPLIAVFESYVTTKLIPGVDGAAPQSPPEVVDPSVKRAM
jgi:hypothetical protein